MPSPADILNPTLVMVAIPRRLYALIVRHAAQAGIAPETAIREAIRAWIGEG